MLIRQFQHFAWISIFPFRLIPREEEILHHLVRGRSNKEIAQAMDLSLGTIALHVSKILEKLGAVDRTRAATLAIERGIVRIS